MRKRAGPNGNEVYITTNLDTLDRTISSRRRKYTDVANSRTLNGTRPATNKYDYNGTYTYSVAQGARALETRVRWKTDRVFLRGPVRMCENDFSNGVRVIERNGPRRYGDFKQRKRIRFPVLRNRFADTDNRRPAKRRRTPVSISRRALVSFVIASISDSGSSALSPSRRMTAVPFGRLFAFFRKHIFPKSR